MLESCVQVLRDLVATLAAITGAVVAILGLQTWRRQLQGNVDLEVSRSILRAAYKTREAIRMIRNPFYSMNETSASRGSEDVEDGEMPRNYDLPLYAKRWDELFAASQDLRVAEIEGEVLWGDGLREALEPLTTCVLDLSISLSEYLRYKRMSKREPAQEAKMDGYGRNLKASGMQTPDAFDQSVEEAISKLESFIRPKMKLRLLQYRQGPYKRGHNQRLQRTAGAAR